MVSPMTTPKRGRPPVPHPRSQTVRYRVTDAELATLAAAAEKAGQAVTDYCRDRAIASARRAR